MKKVSIKNLNGDITHQATFEDPTTWISEGTINNWWGLSERWVSEGLCSEEDIAAALGSRIVGPEGNEHTEYQLPATFTIEIEDVGNEPAFDLLREKRNVLLTQSDWTQLADSPLSTQTKADWATYRQALRDLPANTQDPEAPVWPVKP